MTKQQLQTISIIKKYIAENGYSPSIGDIAGQLGVYPNSVQEQIKRLERDGYVAKTAGVPRSLRLTEKAESL